MASSTQNRAPTHSVYVVQGEGEQARWTRIGAAWPNRDLKGYTMTLDAAPIMGRVVMRENKPKDSRQGALV